MFLFPLSRNSRCVLQNDRVLESQKKDVGSKVNLPFEPAGCGEKNMTCSVPVSVFLWARIFLDDSVMILQVFD